MLKILLINDNEISRFLKKALEEKGHSVTISNLATIDHAEYKDLSAVIDVANAKTKKETTTLFIHNTGEIKSLMDIAKANSAPFILLYKENPDTKPEDSINTAIDFVPQYGKKLNINCAIVQIEDIYGKDINTSQKLGEFIKNVVKNKPVVIKKDLNDLYLMHQDDFVSGITKIVEELVTGVKPHQYTMFSPEPITEIELAHFINELTDLDVKLLYEGDEESVPLHEQEIETYFPAFWKPQKTLEDGLRDLFKQYDIPLHDDSREEISTIQIRLSQDLLAERIKLNAMYEKQDNLVDIAVNSFEATLKNEKKEKKIPQNQFKKKIAYIAIALVFTLALPSIIFLYNVAAGLNYLNKSQQLFSDLNTELSRNYSEKALKRLSYTQTVPKPILIIASIVRVNKKDMDTILQTAKNLAEIIYYSNNLLAYGGGSVLGTSTSIISKPEVNKSIELASLIENNMGNINTKNRYLVKLADKVKNVATENKNWLVKLKNIEPALPKLLGLEGAQTYLLVIQNPNELRPTGGKIESYAIIKIQDGKFEVQKIGSISELDGQLELNNINVSAPKAIQIAFGAPKLLLQDANWDPDFQNSAKQIANLYQKATNNKIDGVIAASYMFAREFLSTIGPIEIQFDTSFMKAIIAGLDTRNILVYHNDDKILATLLKNNWGGSILQADSDDYLYVIDSNIGSNQSNALVKRSILYKGFIPTKDRGFIREVTITYHNEWESKSNPNEDYLNYARVIVPRNSLLNSARIISEDGEQNITKNVTVTPYEAKAMYSADVLVEAGKTVSLIFEYESPAKTYKDNAIDIIIQKQPGVKTEELNVFMDNASVSTDFEFDQYLKFPL